MDPDMDDEQTPYPEPADAADAVGLRPPELARRALEEARRGNWTPENWVLNAAGEYVGCHVDAAQGELDGMLDAECAAAGNFAGLVVAVAVKAGARLCPDLFLDDAAQEMLGLGRDTVDRLVETDCQEEVETILASIADSDPLDIGRVNVSA